VTVEQPSDAARGIGAEIRDHFAPASSAFLRALVACARIRATIGMRVYRFLSTTRRRVRIMKRFKSPRHVQRFLSTDDELANLFLRRRDRDATANLRAGRTQAFATWADVTGVAMAA
jgi:hypothetical protein